jgi:hypothetical protein
MTAESPDQTARTPVIFIKLGAWTPDEDPSVPRHGYGYRPGMTGDELRDSVRAWWHISPERAKGYGYAAAVAGRVIRGVWEIDQGSWRATDGARLGKSKTRWSFTAHPAPREIEDAFLGRAVPAERPAGGAVFGRGSVIAYWPR